MGVQVAFLCSHCPSNTHKKRVYSVAGRAHSYTNILYVVSNWLVLGKLSQRFRHDHIPETFATFQTGITHIRLCCSPLFRAFNHLFETWICNVSGLASEITGLIYPRRLVSQRVKGERGEPEAPHPRGQFNYYLVIICFPIKGCWKWNLCMVSRLYCSSFTSSVICLFAHYFQTKKKKKKNLIIWPDSDIGP